jgi:hypothetical protein
VAGKVAFERGSGDRGDVPRAEVGVTDLSGHAKILARGAAAPGFDRRFDFDGKRVAWYAYGCTGATMHVQSTGAHAVLEGLARCPLRFTRAPHPSHGTTVRLYLDCYGYAGGTCDGRKVSLTLPHSPRSVVGRGADADKVRLTSAGAELLKRRTQLRVRVDLTMIDFGGTREHRHGSITLTH